MPTVHTVRQGDCIDSIAYQRGFFPDTIWNHPPNRQLKDLRKDGNILYPGDAVEIPDLREGSESRGTEQMHRFRRKGVPAKVRMVFYRPVPEEDSDDDGGGGSEAAGGQPDDESVYEDIPEEADAPPLEPIVNEACIIEIDGISTDSVSDGEGMVEIPIPPNAAQGSIRFFAGTPEELTFPLNLGEMDPIDTIVGVRKRLYNLGYRCPAEGDEMDTVLRDALMRFQQENDLDATGEIDQASRDKLVEVHGS